ncbi:metallophosphoesterase family protein [Liquorilactobacillus uvarum]|uniref:Minor capsid protein n=1 Tax=Liquorilactobacillus uvarum DSM 19971 TaxID=1423812 RepID=A0A0R1Q1H9_9LACO|nr:metallophosphoesterase [Liquorilactobacillus uvarum]KRL36628.1 minor capsid protein [Liquorilactobacillus uvarum DSM 19971]
MSIFKNLILKNEPNNFLNRKARLQKQFNWGAIMNWANGILMSLEERFGSYDSKMSEFESKFNAQMSSNTDINEVIDSRTDIKGNKYSTLGSRLNAQDEELNGMSDDIDVSTQRALKQFIDTQFNEVGGSFPKYYQDILEAMSQIPQSNFNIGFITDNHYQMSSYAPNSLKHYAYIAAASRLAKIDAIIAGGDNTNGYYTHDQILLETQQATSVLFNRTSQDTDVFFVMGNHDTGIGNNNKNTPTTCLNEQDFQDLYQTNGMYGETRNNESLYGFKDYADFKIRVIFLNSFDLPWTVNADGTYKYDFLTTGGYQNDQLNWLANVALKTPSNDWQVMIFTHAPIPGTFDIAAGQSEITQYNSDAFVKILNAFQNGTTYSDDDNTRELPINISCDFSSQGEGTIIALISGHIHADGNMVYSGINCIESSCSLCNATGKIANTLTEDCWDIFSVDPVKKTIHAHRFGFGSDRDFDYSSGEMEDTGIPTTSAGAGD